MNGKDYDRPPVRVALMGLGRAMFDDHISFYRANPSMFTIVAACDLVKERRDIVAKDFPLCKMFRQYSDMLDEHDIDLVDIATCTSDHVKHGLMALKKGFWTLLETPMALTFADAQLLRGQAQKSRNRLIVFQRGMFEPDFLLAKTIIDDQRLGFKYELRIRREDFVRRDDWQCVKRLGGGAAYYAMPELLLQALKILPAPPVQMWSELKRIASLGDAEDFARVMFKTRGPLSADIEFNGGCLPGLQSPSFEIRGERGTFRVEPGASQGTLTVIDPMFSFPRRRSSVRTPPMMDLHENFPVVNITVSLPAGTEHGQQVFWSRLYETVRTAVPFPFTLEDSMEAVKFAQLMKKTSPFGK